MSNKIKDVYIKNERHYFYEKIININIFDPNNINIKKYIYNIEYVTIKDSKYAKINRVSLLYLIFNKMNGYFQEINKNN